MFLTIVLTVYLVSIIYEPMDEVVSTQKTTSTIPAVALLSDLLGTLAFIFSIWITFFFTSTDFFISYAFFTSLFFFTSVVFFISLDFFKGLIDFLIGFIILLDLVLPSNNAVISVLASIVYWIDLVLLIGVLLFTIFILFLKKSHVQ